MSNKSLRLVAAAWVSVSHLVCFLPVSAQNDTARETITDLVSPYEGSGMTESTITLYHQTSKRKAEEILLDQFTDCEDSKWFDLDGSVIEGIWLRRWPDPEKDYVTDCDEGNVLFEVRLKMEEMELASYQVREDQWPHTTPLPEGVAGRSYVLPAVIVNSHLATLRVLALVQDASLEEFS